MQPGIYSDIPNNVYHSGAGISKSGLDLIRKSPMHFRARMDSKNDNEPTAAQAIGTAFHSLLLEPEDFARSYVVKPDNAPKRPTSVQRSAKKPSPETIEAIAFWDQFETENAGKIVLDNDENEQLLAMAHSVRNHPAASALLSGAPGVAELSCYWNDPTTGVLCRCRPDYWRADGIIVDLKTTEDASPEGFAKSLVNWRYYVQAPFYLDGIAETIKQSGDPQLTIPETFVFLVVEKKPPYAVAVYVLDRESFDLGRIEYRQDLETFAKCESENVWPGYGDAIQKVGVPQWHLMRNAALLSA
jgi:PDDEXK-like domain of unknown function (DUF3799)